MREYLTSLSICSIYYVQNTLLLSGEGILRLYTGRRANDNNCDALPCACEATPDFLYVPKYSIDLATLQMTTTACGMCARGRLYIDSTNVHSVESVNMGWQTNNKQNHGASDEARPLLIHLFSKAFNEFHSNTSLLSLSLPLQRIKI